jgi:homoserine kinase
MKIHVRAPATTANVGPGFDCVGVALDLWNELEITDGPGEPDPTHLGVRAFAQIAPVSGKRFRWVDRIPRERGLGSSAAVIALGLVAATLAVGRECNDEELLAAGLEFESHADNLAAALAGGVCLTWDGHIARIATTVPATPIAVIPEQTVSTAQSRAALPTSIAHGDAAFNVARAALLGAALATVSAQLFAQALADRLHEPYREESARLLGAVRQRLPLNALGVTLSGSGPSVIVWAEPGAAALCRADLESSFPDARVVALDVTASGAGPTPLPSPDD